MKKLLAAMFAALLMVGCGEEAQWEANPEPYGGLKILAEIKEAKESGSTELILWTGVNQISDLSPLKGLTKLKLLKLDDNQISDLSPLKGLTDLKSLSLINNKITDLSPLKGLTNLKELWLSDNEISDLSPLKGLTDLRVLVLTKNKISDLSPLKGLMNLKELWLGGNPIPKDQKAILRKALPNCDISF